MIAIRTNFRPVPFSCPLAQIHEKKYYEKYEIKGKAIVLVGVSFSKEEKNIKNWIIESQ